MATQNRNPEIRKDTVNDRWVIFSPARARRPSDFKSKSNPNPNPNNNQSEQCPFCLGHEHECAPEIFRVPSDNPSSSAWKIRVIQNLHPALSRDVVVEPGENPSSPDDSTTGDVAISGFGFHDVVIESPVHSVRLEDLEPVRIGDVLLAYKKRIDQLRCHESIKYIQVFKNHGSSAGASLSHSHSQMIALPVVPPTVFKNHGSSAGASLSHSHSQMIALPVVPPTVSARLRSMKEHFDQTGRCSLCDNGSDDLLIDKAAHFFSIVPFAATFPFEIWIIPLDHSSHFHDIDGEKAADLGGLLKLMLRKMSLQLNNPPFNFMIHTTPLHDTPPQLPYAHWFLQIVPQSTGIGGFEMGSGCYINPVFPEDAAKVLREVCIPRDVSSS